MRTAFRPSNLAKAVALVLLVIGAVSWAAPMAAQDALPSADQANPCRIVWQTTVYQGLVDGQWEILRAENVDNGSLWKETRLTNHPAQDTQPRISVVTGSIVFVSDRDGNPELYLMSMAGGTPLRLTHTPEAEQDPTWSRIGTDLVYAAPANGRLQLWRRSGGAVRQLTATPDADNSQPALSPDGQRISFLREDADGRRIWIMDADGGHAVPFSGPLRRLQHLSWSPNGRFFGFDYDADADGYNELFVVDVTTGAEVQKFDLSHWYPKYGHLNSAAVWANGWTPGGALIMSEVYFADYAAQVPNQIEYTLAGGASFDGTCSGFDPYFSEDLAVRLDFDSGFRDLWPPIISVDAPLWLRRNAALLQVGVTDPGPAQPAVIGLEFVDGAGGWQSTSGLRVLHDGVHMYTFAVPDEIVNTKLRIRAIDDAGNQTPWQVIRQDGFRFFDLRRTGLLTDHHGYPLAGQPVPGTEGALARVVSDATGRYIAYYDTDASSGIRAMGDDWRMSRGSPDGNRLVNGTYEDELNGWQPWGELTPTLHGRDWSTATVYAGDASLVLGTAACTPACLTRVTPELDIPTAEIRGPLVDGNGNVHLIQLRTDEIRHLYFPDGHLPLSVTRVGPDLGPDQVFQPNAGFLVGLSPDGSLHVLWREAEGGDVQASHRLYHRMRAPDGAWSAITVVGAGGEPLWAFDPQGRGHLLTRDLDKYNRLTNDYQYRQWTQSNGWQTVLDHITGVSPQTVATDAAGVLHLFWYNNQLFQATAADGFKAVTASPLTQAVVPGFVQSAATETYWYPETPIQVVYDGGNPHLAWTAGQGLYTQQATSQGWQPVELGLGIGVDDVHVVFTNDGGVHFVAHAGFYDENHFWRDGYVYRYRHATLGWQDIAEGSMNMRTATVAPDAAFYLWDKGLWGSERATDTVDGGVQQQITIPADMHMPTLSFMLRTDSLSPTDASWVGAQIDDGLTVTTVYSTSERLPWSLAWAGLTPWAGQTVTLTLVAHQATGEPLLRAAIDEVAVAPWTTPVVTGFVAPDDVHGGSTIRIAGTNFIATPTARIGDAQAAVVWIDDETLDVTIPAGLPSGFYDLTLTNPGGSAVVCPQRVIVGQRLLVMFAAR